MILQIFDEKCLRAALSYAVIQVPRTASNWGEYVICGTQMEAKET